MLSKQNEIENSELWRVERVWAIFKLIKLMIKVAFEESTILPSQSDWLNKNYDDIWKQEVMPLYILCLEKCTVLDAHDKNHTVVCTKFKTAQENIIEFYPHWAYPKLNGVESTHKYLILELTNNYL